MKTYLILLRGINVGGKRKVTMDELRDWFEQQGFQNVITVGNTGNVIADVESGMVDFTILADALSAYKGFEIQLFWLSPDEINDMTNNSPEWWGINDGGRHDLIISGSKEEAIQALEEFSPYIGPENRVLLSERFIFMSTGPELRNKTRLLRISTTAAFSRITVRNANTMHKLTTLMNDRHHDL
ncbi:hypothetical protein C6P08_06365 [Weissella confusa]|uniref:DUF1697 domain-containing protein n=1 Tax=Weissella confusa TaxID=1583 RepID=UPI0010924890|nr:DUF1697 domain-containing protein [Weissella confusa]MBJ7694424.1 DUF1697 domain-containing protein [Weissella confusa]QBZ04824.1 hypothetical protein C6P08_06365 [Weissella confusa]